MGFLVKFYSFSEALSEVINWGKGSIGYLRIQKKLTNVLSKTYVDSYLCVCQYIEKCVKNEHHQAI